ARQRGPGPLLAQTDGPRGGRAGAREGRGPVEAQHMSVFTYSNPPVIRWGAGSIAELGGEIERLGGRRVALVTTRSVAAADAIQARLRAALGACTPVATVTIGQHAPIAEVDSAASEVDAAGADLLVSLGGGSPIDAAKIVAREVADRRGRERSLPHV